MIFWDDIKAAYRNDPALRSNRFSSLEIILYPGLYAIIFHRLAHWLWQHKVPFIPRLISQFARFLTGIEIHPGAEIGREFFIDHGMGVVIGETTVIGENVLIYHGVTLGGTSLATGKRHPTIGNNVIIGAGAKLFGPLLVGDNSQIGGGAVIVRDVPPNSVVVGNPGKVVRLNGEKVMEKLDMVNLPDPVQKVLDEIKREINDLKIRSGSL